MKKLVSRLLIILSITTYSLNSCAKINYNNHSKNKDSKLITEINESKKNEKDEFVKTMTSKWLGDYIFPSVKPLTSELSVMSRDEMENCMSELHTQILRSYFNKLRQSELLSPRKSKYQDLVMSSRSEDACGIMDESCGGLDGLLHYFWANKKSCTPRMKGSNSMCESLGHFVETQSPVCEGPAEAVCRHWASSCWETCRNKGFLAGLAFLNVDDPNTSNSNNPNHAVALIPFWDEDIVDRKKEEKLKFVIADPMFIMSELEDIGKSFSFKDVDDLEKYVDKILKNPKNAWNEYLQILPEEYLSDYPGAKYMNIAIESEDILDWFGKLKSKNNKFAPYTIDTFLNKVKKLGVKKTYNIQNRPHLP